MNKAIKVPDLPLITASLAISIKKGTSTTEQVLAEIIRLSENGIVLYPKILQPTICETLGITPDTYRQTVGKLTKLKLICRDQSTVILDPLIKTPFTSITLVQKDAKTNS